MNNIHHVPVGIYHTLILWTVNRLYKTYLLHTVIYLISISNKDPNFSLFVFFDCSFASIKYYAVLTLYASISRLGIQERHFDIYQSKNRSFMAFNLWRISGSKRTKIPLKYSHNFSLQLILYQQQSDIWTENPAMKKNSLTNLHCAAFLIWTRKSLFTQMTSHLTARLHWIQVQLC
jgi:hypothetical protein